MTIEKIMYAYERITAQNFRFHAGVDVDLVPQEYWVNDNKEMKYFRPKGDAQFKYCKAYDERPVSPKVAGFMMSRMALRTILRDTSPGSYARDFAKVQLRRSAEIAPAEMSLNDDEFRKMLALTNSAFLAPLPGFANDNRKKSNIRVAFDPLHVDTRHLWPTGRDGNIK